MSENDYEFQEVPLVSIDLDKMIISTQVEIAKGEMILVSHECSNPNHRENTVESVIVLLVKDLNGEITPVLLQPWGQVVEDMLSGSFTERLKLVVETC